MKRPPRALRTALAAIAVTASVAVAVTSTLAAPARSVDPVRSTTTAPSPIPTDAIVRRQDLRVTLHLSARTERADVAIAAPADSVLVLDEPDGTLVRLGQPIGRFVGATLGPDEAERAVSEAGIALMEAELDRGSSVGAARRQLDSARRSVDRLAERPDDAPASADEVAAAEAELREARAALEDATARGALGVARANDELVRRRAGVTAANAAATPVAASATGTLRRTSPSTAVIDAGLVVRADLLATQLLRVRSGRVAADATVETTGGKRSVPCAEATAVDDPPVHSTDPDPGSEPATSGTGSVGGVIDCRPSVALDTVAGLPATLTVTIEFGVGVLVVPEIAVSFDELGAPFVVTDGGHRHGVQLGPSDGVLRVVEGISEGTRVVLG